MISQVFSKKHSQAKHAFYVAIKDGFVFAIISSLLLAAALIIPTVIRYIEIAKSSKLDKLVYIFGFKYAPFTYLLLVAFLGCAQALVAFKILYKSTSVNTYFSLGISRSKLFWARYLSGFVLIIFSFIIVCSATIIINLANSSYTLLILSRGLYIMFGFMATAVLAYTITTLVCSLTSTISESIVYGVLANLLPSLLILCSIGYWMTFLWGKEYFSFSPMRITNLFFFSDIYEEINYMSKDMLVNTPNGTSTTYIPIIYSLIVTGILLVLARKFFIHRKAENTGIRGTCKPLAIAIIAPLVFISLSVILLYTDSNINSKLTNNIAIFYGTLLSAILFSLIAFPLKFIERKKLKYILVYPLCLLLCFTYIGILKLGGFGYTDLYT